MRTMATDVDGRRSDFFNGGVSSGRDGSGDVGVRSGRIGSDWVRSCRVGLGWFGSGRVG